MKTKLILVASKLMDSNKKEDRAEHGLIRLSKKAREHMNLEGNKSVELWPAGSTNIKLARTKVLEIFKAYSKDIKKLHDDGMSERNILRVGFVTTNTFNAICNPEDIGNIWLADSIEETVIGGDPEFMLVGANKKAKHASNVDGLSHAQQLGSDGPWAELRPDPEIEVDAFVQNIKQLFNNSDGANCIQDYKWLGGCFYNMESNDSWNNRSNWPIGGHVHIGTPLKIAKAMENDSIFRNGIHATLQKILDELVAIPMMKVEGVTESCERRKIYGKYGESRVAGPHGERLEYRTLSGQWLTHPVLASAVLGTVKAIAHAVFKDIEDNDNDINFVTFKGADPNYFHNNYKTWNNIPIINKYGTEKPNGKMRDILHNGQVSFTKAQTKKIEKTLTELSTYDLYSEHIDSFCEVVGQHMNVLKKQETDLKKTWVEDQAFII